MGMKKSSYIKSWLITAYLRQLIGVLVLLIPSIAFHGYQDIDGSSLSMVILYLLLVLGGTHQAFAFQSIFSRAQVAVEIYMVVGVLGAQMFFFGQWNYVDRNPWIYSVFCFLFPQSGLNLGMQARALYNPFFNINPDFSINQAIFMQILGSIFYFLLFLYLEEVAPNTLGTQQPYNFLCKRYCSKKNQQKNKKNHQGYVQEDLDEEQNQNKTDFSSAKFHQEKQQLNQQKQTAFIKNLSKIYTGSVKAVDNLSFCLYESEIFCLLGHNGSGKSTTINMLTGMLKKNQGQINIKGYNFEHQLDQIRQNIGICGQTDVYFDNMTVREHLVFMSQLKMKSEFGIDYNYIEEVIQKCGLKKESEKQAQNLSGGNKRKLSLAMALIGDPQILFLDEPSSGMDSHSRRIIWNVIKEMKNIKKQTIILTTHYMDEAEVLADRIGIMSKGELVIVGNTDYVKKQMGVGYILTVSEKNKVGSLDNFQAISDDVKEIVSSHIQDAQFQEQQKSLQEKNILNFILPFSQMDQFHSLLNNLEQKYNQILQIQLVYNNLEDVFINIGKMEQQGKNIKDLQQITDSQTEKQSENIKENEENSQLKQKRQSFFKYQPRRIFSLQLDSIFLKKLLLAKRSTSTVLSFFLPIIFQTMGMLVLYPKMKEKRYDPRFQFQQTAFMSVFSLFAYCIGTVNYAEVVVYERELKIKYVLNVQGQKVLPYWLSSLFFDYMMYLLVLGAYFIIGLSIGIPILEDYTKIWIYMLVAAGFSIISFSYLWSFKYKSSATINHAFGWINYFGFFTLCFIIGFLCGSTFINCLLIMISPFFGIYWGHIAFGYKLLDEYERSYIQAFDGAPFEDPMHYGHFFLLQGLIFFIVSIYLDQKYYKLDKTSLKTTNQNSIQEEEQNSKISIKNLQKTYPNGYQALEDLNFEVKKGETIGLLGPNGAGKSTTFGIVTALLPKTQGSVRIKNQEISNGIMDLFISVGICPQFDPIWPNLTVLDHLKIFGRVKGLYGSLLDDQIDYLLTTIQLLEFKNYKSYSLSGGNKRKLSLCIALIGGADITFFDEPSCGVDPIAQKSLWTILEETKHYRQGGMVLTTHSMNEAEYLCSRIGILINGKFYCFGSRAELQEQFGEGVIVKFQSDKIEQVKGVIHEVYGEDSLLEGVQLLIENQDSCLQQQWYQMKIKSENFQYSECFYLFHNSLFKQNLITEFNIRRNSLEEIFLEVSKQQKQEENH